MAKLTKRAEIMENLRTLVEKEANISKTKVADLAQTNISGESGKDTKVESVSDATETTDQNNVGPDKLNNDQKHKQEPSKDPAEPVASPKSAEAIDKLAEELLTTINTKLAAQSKEALAQTGITGKPGKDTKVESVDDSTEKTNQNDVGPDKLNDEQHHEQEPSKDSAKPAAKVKKSEENEELDKKASFDYGVSFCANLLKTAQDIKEAQEKQAAETQLIKEAGRRDFDVLIAQVASELEKQSNLAKEQEKLAEEQGAKAFDEFLKQAQFEHLVEENKKLASEVAKYAEIEKKAAAQAQQIERENEIAKIAALVTAQIKRDLQESTVPTGK